MDLEVENLRVELGGNEIVKNVSFSLENTSFCSLIGPNGAGKTTLLKAIARIYDSWRGRVVLFGKDIRRYSRRELAKILVYTSIEVPRGFRVRLYDLLEASLYHLALSREEVKDRINWIAQELDLEHLLYRKLDTLSSGELQRALIASALIRKPRVLLIDELLAHLDLRKQIEITETVYRYTKKFNTITIAVMHSVELAARYSDYVALMGRGTMIAFGRPEEVLTSENLTKAFETRIEVLKLRDGKYIVYLG